MQFKYKFFKTIQSNKPVTGIFNKKKRVAIKTKSKSKHLLQIFKVGKILFYVWSRIVVCFGLKKMNNESIMANKPLFFLFCLHFVFLFFFFLNTVVGIFVCLSSSSSVKTFTINIKYCNLTALATANNSKKNSFNNN